MGNGKSSHKGQELAVGSYSLGDTAQRASGVVNGPDGSILVSHSTRIVSVDPRSGQISNYAGKHHVGGYSDGHKTDVALFQKVSDLATIDLSVFVVDCDNCRIRVIENDTVSTFAGTGKQFIQDGPRKEASFFYPQSIAVLSSTMYITDLGAGLIRIISPDGIVSTLKNGPGESLWRWKALSSDSSQKTITIEKSPSKDASGSTPQKGLSSSSSDAFEGNHEFEEDGQGNLKFGILKDVAASVISGARKVIYIADEVKATEHATGQVVNVSRVMRFDVEKREVESIVLSKTKPTSPPTNPTSSSKLPSTISINLNGGREISKEGPNVSGLCAVSLNSSHDSCLLISDNSKHSIWRAHIKHTGNVSLASVVGKEGGFKDGLLKSAKLTSPDSLFISPTSGDLYWIDGSIESPDGRLREVKGFEKSVQTMYRAEMGSNVLTSSTPSSTPTKGSKSSSGEVKSLNTSGNGSSTPVKNPLFASQPSGASSSSSVASQVPSTPSKPNNGSTAIEIERSNPQGEAGGRNDSGDPSNHSLSSVDPSNQSNQTLSSPRKLSSSAPPNNTSSHLIQRAEEAAKGSSASSAAPGLPTPSTASSSSSPMPNGFGPVNSDPSSPRIGAIGGISRNNSTTPPTSPIHSQTATTANNANMPQTAPMAMATSSSSHHGQAGGRGLLASPSDPALSPIQSPSSMTSTWKSGSSTNTLHWRNVSGATPPGSGGPTPPPHSSSSPSLTHPDGHMVPPISSLSIASASSVQSPGRTWMAASGQLTPSSSQNSLNGANNVPQAYSPSSPDAEHLAIHRRAAGGATGNTEAVPLSQGFVLVGKGSAATANASSPSNSPHSNQQEAQESTKLVNINDPAAGSISSPIARLANRTGPHPHSAPAQATAGGAQAVGGGANIASSSTPSSAPPSDATHSTSTTHTASQGSQREDGSQVVSKDLTMSSQMGRDAPPTSTSSAPPLLYAPSKGDDEEEKRESINFRIATSMPPVASPSSPWSISIPADFAEQPDPALYDDWTVINGGNQS